MALRRRRGGEAWTVEASSAKTATGTTTTPAFLPGMVNAWAFILDISAAATDAGDTLDVTVQTKLDDENWLDVVAFTQVLGNGGAKTYVEKIVAQLAEAGFETGAALGAGAVRNLIGAEWRASWTIVDSGDADQSFTFSVIGCPM